MSPAPSDTHPAIQQMMIQGYRRMSPADKFRQVEQLNLAVLQLAAARIEAEHPGISERELRLRLAARWLPRETMIRVFDWDPERPG
jgi:hypothetical protein